MRPLFVDTGAWYALADRDDGHHASAASFFREVVAGRRGLVTTNLVVAESYLLIQRRIGGGTGRQWLARLRDSSLTQIVHTTAEDFAKACGLIEEYPDQPFSLTDAVSFAVMRRLRLAEAFAYDRRFRIAGFSMLP